MSYSSFTDAGTDMGISGQTSKLGNGATFGKNTRLQDDGSSSYDTYSKSDPSDRPVKFRRSSVRGAAQDGPSPATRDYTRSRLRKATATR